MSVQLPFVYVSRYWSNDLDFIIVVIISLVMTHKAIEDPSGNTCRLDQALLYWIDYNRSGRQTRYTQIVLSQRGFVI